MLEVGIIICLALLFFFALRHYPETAPEGTGMSQKEKKPNIFSRIKLKRAEKAQKDIENAITAGQESIISPAEIDLAQKSFNEIDPDIAKTLYEANKALEDNDLKTAEDLAIEAIGEDKHCSQAYVIVGKVAVLRGAFLDAKEAFKTALRCSDTNGEAFFELGKILLHEENYSKAIETLLHAVNLDRNNPHWHAAIGKAYMQVRQFAKAAKSLKRAASLDIDNKEYKQLASEAENKQRMHSSVYRFR